MPRLLPPWIDCFAGLARAALGWGGRIAAAFVVSAGAAAAAPALAIVDGPARLVDGRSTVEAVVGLPMDRPLLIQTSATLRLLRLAWAGQGHVDLGPDTQALVLPRGLAERQRGAAAVYVLRGWAKVSAGKAGDTPVLLTPQIDLLSAPGVAVLQVEGGRSSVFGEAGGASVVERNGSRVAVPAGQFHAVAAGQPGVGAARPPGSFLQAVPRAFRDTLPTPPRPAGKPPAPRELTRASYAEVRDWMAGEPALRRAIVTHFSAWARDAAFRAQLMRTLSEHPEWDPIVNPPAPRPAASAAVR